MNLKSRLIVLLHGTVNYKKAKLTIFVLNNINNVAFHYEKVETQQCFNCDEHFVS